MITVDAGKCPQNHVCPMISQCPQGAISQVTPFSLPKIDKAKCIECMTCVAGCPKGAFVVG